jgi:hypothetical protein
MRYFLRYDIRTDDLGANGDNRFYLIESKYEESVEVYGG